MRRSPLVTTTTTAVTAVTAAAIVLLTGCSAGTPATPAAGLSYVPAATAVAADPGSTILTTATGTITAVPDVMTIVLGVQTEAASATGALAENSALAAEVIATLKGSGVAPADLQTDRLSVYPQYNDDSVITGYQVANTLRVTLRDLGTAGTVIDAVAETAGDAIRVQQIGFAFSDETAAVAGARTAAVKQAQLQAQQLAAAGGVQLGAVLSITESSPNSPMPYYPVAQDAAAADVPIEPGTQDVSISVQVVYEIAR